MLPPVDSTQHKVLASVLCEEGSSSTSHREGLAAERLSLRDLRLSSSRPSTASRLSTESRPGTTSRPGTASRPPSGSSGSRAHPACGDAMQLHLSDAKSQILSLDKVTCEHGTCAKGSPSTSAPASRPLTPGSVANSASGSFTAEALEGGRRSRGGVVIAQLRSALEEERLALLAQIEQLRLSIYDEHEYRGRAVTPPPTLTQMQELKRSLQRSLEQHDYANNSPAFRSPPLAERRSLSRYAPLPELHVS